MIYPIYTMLSPKLGDVARVHAKCGMRGSMKEWESINEIFGYVELFGIYLKV